MKATTKFILLLVILMISAAVLYAVGFGSGQAPSDDGEMDPPDNPEVPVDEAFELTVPFEVNLPNGWAVTPRQGIDSSVGEISNGDTTIRYDYGWYGGSRVETNDPDFVIETFESGAWLGELSYANSGAGPIAAEFKNTSTEPETDNPLVPLMETTLVLYADNVPVDQLDAVIEIIKSIQIKE